ncbi:MULTISPECIES: hypothetical protein [unclassified Neisseria]|nr:MULTISPECIES: hypothetical protein [unclassified Neisseria]
MKSIELPTSRKLPGFSVVEAAEQSAALQGSVGSILKSVNGI